MKRIIASVIASMVMMSAVSALDLSAGLTAGVEAQGTSTEVDAGIFSSDSTQTMNFIVAKGFFDAQYILVEAGIKSFINGEMDDEKIEDLALMQYTFSLLGKYPIALGSNTLAPVVGLEYTMIGSAELDGEDVSDSLENELWIKGGVLADFNLGSKMYLRPAALIGYRFLTSDEKDMISDVEDAGFEMSILPLRLDLSISLGFKL